MQIQGFLRGVSTFEEDAAEAQVGLPSYDVRRLEFGQFNITKWYTPGVLRSLSVCRRGS